MKIIFKGELSSDCRKQIVKRYHKKISLFFSIIALFSFIAAIIFIKSIIFSLFLVIFVSAIIIAIFPNIIQNEKKDIERNLPSQITIDNEYVELEGTKNEVFKKRSIKDIKNIVENDQSYCFNFYFLYDLNFICQKDLLVEGTLEDFEQLFAGLIVRKKSKK